MLNKFKKCFSLLLICALLIPHFPFTALANELPEQRKLRVVTPQDTHSINVFLAEDELLMEASDLALITGFEYEFDDSSSPFTATYTRNQKQLEVYVDTNEMWPIMEGNTQDMVTFATEPKLINGEWYLPAAEMLPWLNVFCGASKGKLYIYPDALSYYDIIEAFDMDHFDFNFVDTCEAIGVSNNNLRVTAFFQRQGITGTIKHGFSYDGNNPFKSYGSYKTCYSVFENFIKDRTAAVDASASVEAETNVLDFSTDFWETISDMNNLPEEAKFFSNVGESLTMIELGMDIAQYYSLMNQDNTIKLGIMKKIEDGDYTDIYTENTEKAAASIYKAYTDFWYGLLMTAENVVEDEVIDKLVDTAVGVLTGTELLMVSLDAVDLAANVTVTWDEAVDNIRVYEAITPSAQEMFEVIYGDYDYNNTAIETKIGNAILYLYCMEQCYLGMNQYMYETRHYDYETYTKFEQLAREADEWQGKFLAVYQARLNDSVNMNSFGENGILRQDYVTYLKDLFKEVDLLKGAPDKAAYIEYAFVIQGLRDTIMHNDYKWCLKDIDGDGGKELVVGLDFETSGYPAQLLIDAGSVTSWYLQRRGVNEQAFYVAAADDSTIYLHDQCFDAPEKDDYLHWNGTSWETTESPKVQELSYDSPALTDFVLKGDSDNLLTEIEDYFKSRHGYIKSIRADLGDDGTEDLLIALDNAVKYWFDYLECETECYESFAYYEAQNYTLLAAESVSDGVRIRFVNRPISELPPGIDSAVYSVDGSTLTIGDFVLNYNEKGEVYTKPGDSRSDFFQEETTTLMDLFFMEKKGVMTSVDNYHSSDDSVATCTLAGTPVTIMYDGQDVIRVTAENTAGNAQIVEAFPLNLDFASLWYAIPSISDWSYPDATPMGYTTEFLYQDPATGMNARCQITFNGTNPDSKVIIVSIGTE